MPHSLRLALAACDLSDSNDLLVAGGDDDKDLTVSGSSGEDEDGEEEEEEEEESDEEEEEEDEVSRDILYHTGEILCMLEADGSVLTAGGRRGR